MPYTADNVPDNVPDDKAEEWANVWNSAYDTCMEAGGSPEDCEESAFAQANGKVLEEDRVAEREHPHGDHTCYCPECGYEQVVGEDVKCKEQVCPECGASMRAEDVGENKTKGGVVSHLERLWSKVQAAFAEALGTAEEPPDRAMAGWDIMDQVYAQMNQSDEEVLNYAWPLDLFLDEGQLYMVITSEGKLYRAKIDVDESTDTVILGEWRQIITDHVPVESRVSVIRQADGKYRLVAIANTAILNRVGEIDSMAMFDSFIRRAEESGEYPFVTFYHITHPDVLPIFRMGQCDFLARDEEVYIASALIDEDTPLGPAMIRTLNEDPEPWGTSIGFNPLSDPELVTIGGVKIPVYDDGEHKELSLILEEDAAALCTAVREEVIRMDDRITDALKKLGLSEEKVEEFAGLVDGVKERVRAEGLITRTEVDPPESDPAADDPPADVVAAKEPPEDPKAQVDVVVLDEEGLPGLAEGLLATEAFNEVLSPIGEALEALAEQMDSLVALVPASLEEVMEPVRERLDALEKTDDEKRKEWEEDLPAKRTQIVTYRPRKGGTDARTTPPSYEEIAEKTLENVP